MRRTVSEMDQYRKEVLESLYSMYMDGILTDVTFRVGGVNISCHRNILAASSPYFRAMFTNPVIEKEETIIPIQNIESDVLETVIGFLYTGQVRVTNENAQDLMVAGAMFELPHLIGQCTDHMIQELCTINCIELFIFASHFACEQLKDGAKYFILEHFTELFQTDEKIFDLNVEDLEEIVSNDNLCVEKEESVFDFLAKWASLKESRQCNFARLFTHVRLSLIDEDYFNSTISKNAIVANNSECQQIIRRYVRHKIKQSLDQSNVNEEQCHRPFNTTPRYGMYNRPMLVFSSGGNSADERSLTTFDPITFKNYIGLKPHPTFDFKFKVDHYQLATVSENKVFFLGGIFYEEHHLEDLGSALRDVYLYNIKSVKWEPVTSMRTARCCFSVSVVGKNIIAIGGKSKYPRGEPTNAVESYDTENDMWIDLSSVPIKLYAHASAATKDAIFVFGGKDEDDEYLDTVFRYDIRNDSWTIVTTQLTKPRAFLSAFMYRHKIYVFGGISMHENILTVSIYDPDKNKWNFGTDFPEERRITSTGYHDGTIFVCGGVRHLGMSGRRSRQVESRDLYKYDIDNECWTKVVKLVQYGNPQPMTFAVLNTKYLNESDFISTA